MRFRSLVVILLIIAAFIGRGFWLEAVHLNRANIALMKAYSAPGGPHAELASAFTSAEIQGPLASRWARLEGIAHLWAGQPGRAVATLERAAALEGIRVSPVTQIWLGDAYQAMDDTQSAIRAWDRAGGARLLGHKGDELRQAGQLAAATAVFEAAIRSYPDAAVGYTGLGQVAVDRHDWAAAETWFTQALALDPNATQAHTGLATVLIQQGRYDDARNHLEQAIALKPGDLRAYLLMGDAFAQEGSYTLAQTWYTRAALLFPSSAEPDIRLALAAIAQGQPQEAFAALEAAGHKDPYSPQRHIALAQAYRLAGGPQALTSAIAALEQATALAPNNLWAWVWLGDNYRDAGRCAESQAAYARAAQLDPANAQVAAHQAVPCRPYGVLNPVPDLSAVGFSTAEGAR